MDHHDSDEPADGRVDLDLDHHARDFLDERHARYAELRATCPVAWNRHHGGYWLVTDYASVAEVARDNETFAHRYDPEPEPDGVRLLGIAGVPRPRSTPRQGVAETDGPEHADLRRLLNPFLVPQRVEQLRPRTAELAGRFLAEAIDRAGTGDGQLDLVNDFASPVPAVLTLELMGMPSENWQHYADFFHATASHPPKSPEFTAAVARVPEMMAELVGFAAHRRDHPGDDITTALTRGTVDGRSLTDAEIGGVMWNLVAGGLDTTTSLVAWALHHLGCHPEDRARLVGDPDRIPVAIDELLRHFCPNETLTRTATRDVDLGGRRIRRGDVVMISWVSANHDPAVFDRPDEVILDRVENRHLAFGLGGHRCIGSHLARMESEVMIRAVLDRIPDYEIDAEGFRPYPGNVLMTGIVAMPVRFAASAAAGPTA